MRLMIPGVDEALHTAHAIVGGSRTARVGGRAGQESHQARQNAH